LPLFAAVLGLWQTPAAHATISAFSITQNQSGGITAPVNAIGDTVSGVAICPANPTPGCDFSLSDALVRTHDIVEYGFNFNNVGTDNNVEITAAAPIGMVWDVMPGFCGTGSTLNKNPAPGTGDGVTTASVLVCKLTGAQINQSQSLPLRGRVLGLPNGTTLTPTGSIKSTETPSALNATGPVNTVSSAPRFDLIKARNNSTITRTTVTDINGVPVDGFLIGYALGLLVDGSVGTVIGGAPSTNGRVGAAPLENVAFNITDLMSNLPANTSLIDCANTAIGGTVAMPGSIYSAALATRRVQNSGSVTCSQVASGNNATITWSGIDTTLNHVPTFDASGLTALPAGVSYAAVVGLRLVVPITSIPIGTTVAINNCLSGFDPNGAVTSGAPVSNFLSGNEPGFAGTGNNCRIDSVSNTPAGAFSKFLYQNIYSDTNPGGAATVGSGDGNLAPGAEFFTRLTLGNTGATPLSNSQVCDVWDNRKQRLKKISTGVAAGQYLYVGNPTPQGPPFAIIEYNSGYVTSGFPDAVVFPNAAAIKNECSVGTGWVSDPSLLPGGINSATKVRINRSVFTTTEALLRYKVNFETLGANPITGVAWPSGTVVPDWAIYRSDELNNGWTNNTYNPGVYPGVHSGAGNGDRVILQQAVVRLNKVTLNTAGTLADNSVNSVTAGGSVGYALLPSITAATGGTADITVYDILPVGMSFIGGTSSVGGVASAPTVSTCTAVNAPVPGCATAGQQALTWVLGTQTQGTAVPEIRFRAQVPVTAVNGSTYVNTAVVTAPQDTSPQTQRTVTRQVSVSVPAGLLITKSVTPTLIEPNGSFSNTVTYVNTSSTPLNKPDFIDILPAVGDGSGTWASGVEGRVPPSIFAGTRTLQSVTATTPNGFVLYVTNAPIASIDKAPSVAANLNPGVGASIWCQASITAGVVTVAGGQPAGCASTNSATLTAVRVVDNDLAYPSSDGARSFTLNFSTASNALGDLYTNDAGGFASSGITFPVISNDVTVTVVKSTLAGKVYRDDNNNGAQGAGEAGIAGVTVTLCNVNTNPCPAANVVGAPQVTDGSGNYKFTGVLSGTYYVFQTQPAGYTSALANAPGSSGGTNAGTDGFQGITLGVGVNAVGYNFGETGTGKIGMRKAMVGAPTPVAGQPGVYDVVFQVAAKNMGTASLRLLSMNDTVCGTGGAFTGAGTCTIQSAPVVTLAGVGTTAVSNGAAYTGLSAGNDLLASGAVLEVGGEVTVDFTVRVDLSAATGFNFNNQASATGTPSTTGALPLTDVSNNGSSYTGGADTDPTGSSSNAPTPIKFAVVQGRVFRDLNNDGVLDVGEVGLTTTVDVTGGALATALTVNTDTSGNYFAILPISATAYAVSEAQPSGYQDGKDGASAAALSTGAAAGAPLSSPVGYSGGTADAGTGGGVGADRYSGIVLSAPGIYGNFNFGEIAEVSVRGSVFNDVNGLIGSPANTVDGTPTNAGSATLKAFLIQGGNVVASVAIDAMAGTYSFAGVAPGAGYNVVLANASVADGQPAPAASLPTGWVNTGENIGTTAGSDAAVNGTSATFSVALTTPVIDVNFGIEQTPTAGVSAAATQPNPGNTTTVPVPVGLFTGLLPSGATGTTASDPTAVTDVRVTAMPSNTTSITLNSTQYGSCPTCTAFPATGGVTVTLAQLATTVLDPVDGALTAVIDYVAVDAAGKESAAGSVSLPFSALNVSGNVFNDVNGLNGAPTNTVDGTGTNAAAASLTAYLVQGGNVVASSPVSATGTYSIANVPVGTGYTVVLANTSAVVANGQPAPAASLPTGWVNTGENNAAAAGSDGTVNGVSASFAVATVSVTDVNFGIEQPPTAGASVAASQPNPGGVTTVAVPSGLFVGPLPSGATGTTAADTTAVTSVRITGLNADINSITLGGTLYGTCPTCTALPGAGVPLTLAQLASVVLDPVDGNVTPLITYVAIDLAGQESAAGSVSLPLGALSVSGNVFKDVNGLSGTPANTVDGTGTNASATSLTAYLVQGGNVVSSSPVAAAGTYSMANVPVGTGYTVVLANTPILVANGQPAPGASLPVGWANTGENNAVAAGSDGTVDGKSASFAVSTANVTNVNFGIEQPPTAGAVTAASQPNPGGTATVAVPAGLFTGALPVGASGTNAADETAVTSIRITALPSNTTSITINGTQYGACPTCTAFPTATGVTVTVAQLAAMVLDPVDGTITPVIPYVALDAAGKESSPGSVNLPLGSLSITGNVFDDTNGLSGTPANTVDGAGTNAGSTALTAYLVQGGTVISSAAVTSGGSFSINNAPVGTGYTVVIANTSTVVANGQPAPGASLPVGWVNTGENNAAAAGSDGAVNGASASFDVVAVNVNNINFGIEQLPTAGVSVAASQVNPGGVATVAVDAGLFVGTLPTGATGSVSTDPTAVTAVRITALPSNTTSITLGGTLYGSCPSCTAFPTATGVTLTTAQLAGMVLDPVDGAVTPVIPYVAIDAAGKESAAPGSVSLPLSALGVSGNVFNDVNGLSGTPANTVDGIGTNASTASLTAYLVRGGNVVASAPINATGSYSFANVAVGTGYSVVLANTASVVANGQPAPSASLPAGWVNTGENNSVAAGSDGTIDGKSASFDVTTANVDNVNFGIEQPPTVGVATAAPQANPGGLTTLSVPAGLFTGSLPVGATGSNATDPTAVTAVRITALPSNTTSILLNGVSYGTCPSCTAFPTATGVTVLLAQLSSVAIDPVDGAVTLVIPYVAIDAAGQESTPGSVSLPLTSVSVAGNVFNDVNGLSGTPANTVDGVGTNAATPGLTAYLVQGGNVVGSSPVAANGTYAINNVPVGTGYTVVLANTPVVVVNGQAAPSASLPAGWANTGETNAASATPAPGSDGTINGVSAPFVVAASVDNVNFAIEQPPVAGNSVMLPATNPGGTTPVSVPPGAFTGTLPTGATGTLATDATAVTAVRLSAMPTNATSFTVTVGGIATTYGPANTPFPASGITIPLADLPSLSVDPQDNVADTTLAYYPVDAAGLESPTAGSVKLPLQTIDLKVEVAAVGTFVKGLPGTYQLTVTNVGTGATSGVTTVTNTLPPGLTYVPGSAVVSGAATPADFTCTAGPVLATGQVVTCTSTAAYVLPVGSAVIKIDLRADIALTAGTPCVSPLTGQCVVDNATVATPGDSVPANNTASVTTPLVTGPDLVLVKTALTSPMTVNNDGQYTLQVSNVGPVAAPFVAPGVGAPAPVITVTDTLPAGMTFVSGVGTGWTCALAQPLPIPVTAPGTTPAPPVAQTVSCTTNQLIAASGGTAAPITLTVKPTLYLASQTVVNNAQVQGGGEPVLNFDSTTPANNGQPTANNNGQASVKVQEAASLTGVVWRDVNHDRQLAAANEPRVAGFIAEVINPADGKVLATTKTDANGAYRFDNLLPGTTLKLQFRDPATGGLVAGVPSNNDQAPNTVPGASYTNPAGAKSTIATSRDGLLITLVPGNTLTNQSLPLDPAGVVYDSLTRQPVGGAVVTLLRDGSPVPVSDLIGYPVGATTNAQTTCGPDVTASCPLPGAYQFLLQGTAPAGAYTIQVVAPNYVASTSLTPAGASYTPVGAPGSVVSINQDNLSGNPPPQVGQNTTYYYAFTLNPAGGPGVVNNHIPLDPAVLPTLVITKTGDKTQVELGDNVRYTLTVRRTDNGVGKLSTVAITDTLPAGFRYIPGTLVVNGTPVADSQAGLSNPGITLPININFATPPLSATANPGLAAGGLLTVNYRVRVAVGAMQGTGINRAQARLSTGINCATTPAACSNEAQYKVKVTGGVFTPQACVSGKVYVDCNNNQVQDAEELGIPGVRLYLNDGTSITVDSEGKYSVCDLAPKTWVLKADKLTLPKGSRLVTSSSRNVGDAGSLFLDLKNGELMRADFIEGSCSNTVLEQVKARRTQGEISAPGQGATQTEKKGGDVLKFESKKPGYAQEGTDSANQPLVKPRTPAGKPDDGKPEAELNQPVSTQKDVAPALPAPATRGAGQ
jgi:uncharacterized repeat protein (TIGR01451 family)